MARPHHYRGVELDGDQRDGVRHVLFLDQRGNKRLVGRAAEGLGDPRIKEHARMCHTRTDVQHPPARSAGRRRPSVCTASQQDARGAPRGPPPRRRSGTTGKSGWSGTASSARRNAEWAARYQPRLRDLLHPGADARRTSANPHEAEVAILKRLEDPSEHVASKRESKPESGL